MHRYCIDTDKSLAATYTVRFNYICTYSVCTYNQDIKFPYNIIKIYCFKGLDSVSTAITSPVSQKSVWPAKLQYAMRAKL